MPRIIKARVPQLPSYYQQVAKIELPEGHYDPRMMDILKKERERFPDVGSQQILLDFHSPRRNPHWYHQEIVSMSRLSDHATTAILYTSSYDPALKCMLEGQFTWVWGKGITLDSMEENSP